MKNLLLIFLLPVIAYGQGDQRIIKVPVDNSKGTEKAIIHLPDDYHKTSTNYPLMVFLNGVDEGGPNPATIYNHSMSGGPAYYIAHGQFPSSFVNPADGKSYKFIVVSPQNPVWGSTPAERLEYILTSLVKKYRIDVTRIYLTGLSAGGEGILEYVGKLTASGARVKATHKIAAVIPMSAVMNAAHSSLLATTILTDKVHIWGFGSPTDTHGANTLNLIGLINTLKGGYGKKTAYEGGHCCWGQFYNPDFNEGGMNIYQWALQYTQGASPAPPPPAIPVADAGSDQTITLPASEVNLNGTASKVTGGTIVKYAWSQQSGPSKARIKGVASSATTVTGLKAGSYVFQLTITDNTGKTDMATAKVTVNPAVPVTPPTVSQAIPGTIQAESYSAMSDIETQGTSDAGGGRNVGWIDKGDWMDYTVNVAAAGAYMVNFRIAAPSSGCSFQLRSASGAVLTTVNPGATGNFQNWRTESAIVILAAGRQVLRIYSTSSVKWNLNWMQFEDVRTTAQAIPGTIQAENYSTMSGIRTENTTDAGRGQGVGYVDNGDWMDYAIDAASAGTYKVSFRIATIATGAGFQLKNSSGVVLATLNLPSTGGYQKWRTVTANVTLPAGAQIIRIVCTSLRHWNLNWMQFARGSSAAAVQTTAVSGTSSQLAAESAADADSSNTTSPFALFPNPVQGQFMIRLNNAYMGNMRIQIVDVAGVIRQTYKYDKNQPFIQLTLSAGNLPTGTYFVRVQIGTWSSEVRKIIKL